MKPRVRPVVESILGELLARHRAAGHVHLNDIAEVIGARSVTYDEVEHLIVSLEAEGLRVGEPLDGQDITVMKQVLAAARALRAELERAPTVEEIAARSGHANHVVRRALEYGAGRKDG
jgi:Sigma-70 region 3